MSTPFLGEIKIISWNFAPRGWAFCSGQLLPINQVIEWGQTLTSEQFRRSVRLYHFTA